MFFFVLFHAAGRVDETEVSVVMTTPHHEARERPARHLSHRRARANSMNNWLTCLVYTYVTPLQLLLLCEQPASRAPTSFGVIDKTIPHHIDRSAANIQEAAAAIIFFLSYHTVGGREEIKKCVYEIAVTMETLFSLIDSTRGAAQLSYILL